MKRLIFAAVLCIASVAYAQTVPPSTVPPTPPPLSIVNLSLSTAEIRTVVEGQTTDYLRWVLTQRCAVIQCTPILVALPPGSGTPPPTGTPPPVTVPTGFVGLITGVTTAGVISGRVVAGSSSVGLFLDGSQVNNAVSITPAADGTFTAQLPAALHDGRPHEITAYSMGPDAIRRKFDQVDGNGQTFSFGWK